MDYEGKEFFDQFPKIIKQNEYILILNKGTIMEKIYSSYESEIEAHRAGKRLQGKKTVIKADVTYTDLGGLLTIHDYEEVE